MNRAPSTLWPTRKIGTYPQHYVSTTNDDGIQITAVHSKSLGDHGILLLSRADARLLAKRINQCLDETRKQ